MGNAKINWLLGWEATRLLASHGWLKSCTTKDDDYPDPIIYRVLYIPGGAGFLPSTVAGHPCRSFLERENTHIDNHKHVRKNSPMDPIQLNGMNLLPYTCIHLSRCKIRMVN